MKLNKYFISLSISLGLIFIQCNLKQEEGSFFILDLASGQAASQALEFKVGGSLAGLTSGNVTLQLNGTENLNLTQNGNFQFASNLSSGTDYDVVVVQQPTGLSCSINNDSGKISNTSVSNLEVICNNGKKIFITAANYNGNLTSSIGLGTFSNGILGADARCMADTNKPTDSSTYKAFIVDGSNRRACQFENCGISGRFEGLDWVLKRNIKYIRASDSTNLFTSNNSAIYLFGNFNAPLSSGGPVQTWTGFAQNVKWVNSSNDCEDWTSSDTGDDGRAGSTNQTDYTSIRNSNTLACNQNHHLICVEQ